MNNKQITPQMVCCDKDHRDYIKIEQTKLWNPGDGIAVSVYMVNHFYFGDDYDECWIFLDQDGLKELRDSIDQALEEMANIIRGEV